jgi:hypothetical protein
MPEPAADIPDLPDDFDALKALAARLLAERDVLGARVADLEADLALLQAKYCAMRRKLYGPRADTLETDVAIDQMLLDFAKEMESRPVDPEGLPKDEATGTADQRRVGATQDGSQNQAKDAKKKPRGRRRIGDLSRLPVVDVPPHDLTEAEKACPCCGTCRTHSGTEESWQVEYVPGHFVRLRHARHTYACRSCETEGFGPQMQTAARSRETAPVEKGMAGPGLMAFVVTSPSGASTRTICRSIGSRTSFRETASTSHARPSASGPATSPTSRRRCLN